MLRVPPERDDRVVFDDEPRIGFVAARDTGVEVALKGENLAIRAPP